MRFTVNRTKLLNELGPVEDIAPKKDSLPMLSNVLLECGDFPLLHLSATDLDVFLRTSCEVEVHQPGSAVVNARKLLDIAKLLDGEDVDFTTEPNDWVRVTCGDSDFRMAGQAKEHFLNIPISNKPGISIPAGLLHGLIAKTVFAITNEESRYALQGALFTLNEGRFKMVATDGHRLSLAEDSFESNGADVKVIIPKKALAALLKLTALVKKAEPVNVELSVTDDHIFVTVGERHLASRMLAGQFPNYDLVIPKTNDKHITLKTRQFGDALKRAGLMADSQGHGVKLHFGKDQLIVVGETGDRGSARDPIAIDYKGNKLSIGFNAHYLLEFLDAAGTEEIVFGCKDETSPALLRPIADGQPSGFQYVAMPMRLL